MAEEYKIQNPEMNIAFANTMNIAFYVSLIVLLGAGFAYLLGFHQFTDPVHVAKYWGQSASYFWLHEKGIAPNGYGYFLNHIHYMDCLSIFGIACVAMVPFISLISAFFKADGAYKLIILLLMAEFLFAIFKPYIMHVAGE